MSDNDMSPMCLPSCMYTSEPSSSSSECVSGVKKIEVIDTVLIKEEDEEPITQTLYTPNESACMYHHQRNPPNYIEAVYQNGAHIQRSCSFTNQQNMPVYSNMNSTHHTNRVHHGGVVKRKRVRTAFTTNQLQDLEEQYRINRYLERGTRMFLSRKLNVSERIIKIWFQNRRMKEKKDRAECQVDSCSLPTQSSSSIQESYVPISTYNILPQAINNSGIMNCDNFVYEPNQSVNFGVAPMMADHVLIPRVLEPPAAVEAMPFDRYSNSMPPQYESEVSSTVFSEFSQYCDAYNAD